MGSKPEFEKVTVIGAGLLGHALALVYALGGCSVSLHDINQASLVKAMELINSSATLLASMGAVSDEQIDAALCRIRTCADLAESLQSAELVAETIVEDPELKKTLYARISELAPAQAVLASNTSYLDIFALLPMELRSRSMIVHWYTPPYLVDLVDVVGNEDTDPALVRKMTDFLESLGKKAIVLRRFIPGYIANRIQSAITLEVLDLLDKGIATESEIDMAIQYGLAERMLILGHLKRMDFGGLNSAQRFLANRTYIPPEARGRSDVVDQLVSSGKLGVTSGEGFYDYGGRDVFDLFEERDKKMFALKKALADIGRM